MCHQSGKGMSFQSKYSIILLWIVLMISVFFIVNKSLTEDFGTVKINQQLNPPLYSLPQEQDVFRRSYDPEAAQPVEGDPELERSLMTYYDNRAYAGAPPTIPHEVLSEKGIGGKSCLQCHEHGGFVARFNAYAPVTPHPEYESCKQCHVPTKTKRRFAAHQWQAAKASKVGNSAMPGSPPVIPHDLQMRSNCMACHSGPAAPKEIRVSHPERSNCRQCHVPVGNAEKIKESFSSSITWKRINENEAE